MIYLTSTALGGEGAPIAISGHHIESITPNRTTGGAMIRMVSGDLFVVVQTMDEIMHCDDFPDFSLPGEAQG